MTYEIKVDEVSTTIICLLIKEVDNYATNFRNYDLAKSKITMVLKTIAMLRKNNKIVKKFKEQFGEDVEGDEGEEENEDDEDKLARAPLALTQGQGEDEGEEEEKIDEGTKGEEANESYFATKEKKRK